MFLSDISSKSHYRWEVAADLHCSSLMAFQCVNLEILVISGGGGYFLEMTLHDFCACVCYINDSVQEQPRLGCISPSFVFMAFPPVNVLRPLNA